MKRNLLLLWGSLALVVLFAIPSTALASPEGAGNETGEVGMCVIGVESPCNGPAVDGTDREDSDSAVNVTGDEGEPIQFHPDELPYASGMADEDSPETESSGGLLSGLVAWFQGLLTFLAGLF